MNSASFVPDDFVPPTRLVAPAFVLEPLGPQHNEGDYAAWTSSMDHILATPGFVQLGAEHPWPHPMALEENLRDLVRHAEDFAARRGFTYTVLDPAGNDVIGCLYIYPSKDDVHDARVRSWVTATRVDLDHVLWRAVSSSSPLGRSGIRNMRAASDLQSGARSGTSRELIHRLNDRASRALAHAEVARRMATLGAEARPMTPEQFAEFVRDDSGRRAE